MRSQIVKLMFVGAMALVYLGLKSQAQPGIRQAHVTVSATEGLRDLRPLGKYLAAICSISDNQRTASCAYSANPSFVPPKRPWPDQKDQDRKSVV